MSPYFMRGAWIRADAWRLVLVPDSQEEGVLCEMKDAVVSFCEHNNPVPGVLEKLAPPALPADRFPARPLPLTLQAIGRSQDEHQQREDHM
jgi:hypothetical protein